MPWVFLVPLLRWTTPPAPCCTWASTRPTVPAGAPRCGRPCCGALTGRRIHRPVLPPRPARRPSCLPRQPPLRRGAGPDAGLRPPGHGSRSSPLPAIPEPTGYGRRRGGRWRSPLWPQTTTPTGWPRRRRWPQPDRRRLEVELRAWRDDYLQALTAGEFDLYLGEVRLTADFDLTAFLTPAAPQLRQVQRRRGAEPPERLPGRRGTVADGAGPAAL